MRKAPEQAVALNPYNGLAQEQLAFQEFRELIAEGVPVQEAAKKAAPRARLGLKYDPLAPKSYAILAMAEANTERRSNILAAANKLNRRDQLLQRLVLEEYANTNDYLGVVTTADQLLRVHPETRSDFFPALTTAVQIDEAAVRLPAILTGDAPWHQAFLRAAVRDDEALPNLAKIRGDIAIEDEVFDRQLITGLARIGEVDQAYALYEDLLGRLPRSEVRSRANWASDFPPFDWALTEQRDFRAQLTRDLRDLELYARSGQGGVIARRVLKAPQVPFTIESALTMRASGRSEAVRLYVRCVGEEGRLLDQPFDEGDNRWTLDALPADCENIVLEVNARSLRGDPTLRAELTPLEITER